MTNSMSTTDLGKASPLPKLSPAALAFLTNLVYGKGAVSIPADLAEVCAEVRAWLKAQTE